MDNTELTFEEWYHRLQQYTSAQGRVGLPAKSGVEYLYNEGHTIPEAFDILYPPQPVTVDAATQQPVTGQEVAQATEQSQELALAQSIPEPRVTETDVMKRIVSKTFTLLPAGSTVMCEIILDNGFYAYGKSVMSSRDEALTEAQAKALQEAVREAWKMEVYLLREKLYRQKLADLARASIGITDQSNA